MITNNNNTERGNCGVIFAIAIAIIIILFFVVNGLSVPTVTTVSPDQIPSIPWEGLEIFSQWFPK